MGTGASTGGHWVSGDQRQGVRGQKRGLNMQVVDIFMVSKHYVSMQDHMKILYYTNHAGGSLSSEKWQEGQGEKRSPRLVAIASLLRDFSPLVAHVKYVSLDVLGYLRDYVHCSTKCS